MSVQPRSGAAGDAPAHAVLAHDAHARRLVLLGIDEHHVRDVDRPLALDDAAHGLGALRAGHLARPGVALDDVQALDVDPLLARLDAQDLAGLAAVLAADD